MANLWITSDFKYGPQLKIRFRITPNFPRHQFPDPHPHVLVLILLILHENPSVKHFHCLKNLFINKLLRRSFSTIFHHTDQRISSHLISTTTAVLSYPNQLLNLRGRNITFSTASTSGT